MKRSHQSKFSPRNSFKDQQIVQSLTQQTVPQALMDLKISPLLKELCQAVRGTMHGSHMKALTESHISRLGYCFVSGHVNKPIPDLRRQQPVQLSSVYILQRTKSLGTE